MRAPRHCARRHRDGADHLAGLEHRLDVRGRTRQAMEVDEWYGALTIGPEHLDGRIERNKRDREVRGIRGDTVPARAEHGVPAVFTINGGAAGARRALVAGGVADVAKIGTP